MRTLRFRLIVSVLVGVFFALPLGSRASAMGGTFDWVSHSYTGGNLNDASNGAQWVRQGISSDGRYTLFTSGASNAVASDTNGYRDLFMHDSQSNTTTMVSVGPSGQQGNADVSSEASMSGDARYVVFSTFATNFTTNDFNSGADIFLRDMQTGTTTHVCGSPYSGVSCASTGMSKDGRYITYVEADFFAYNGVQELYRYDRTTGISTLVSANDQGDAANASPIWGQMTEDGRYVFFGSAATNLVPNDTNGKYDIFRKDTQTGAVVLVSATTSAQSNGDSQWPTVSDDGRYVAFTSLATNFTSGASGTDWEGYLKDMDQGTIQAVGGTATTGNTGMVFVTGDGSKVMFGTGNQLSSTDTDNAPDVYSWDRVTNTNRRLSEKADGSSLGLYGSAVGGSSSNGRYTLIGTNNMVDPNDTEPAQDVYVYGASPAAPTSLTAPSPTKNKPALSWSAVAGTGITYHVYRNNTLIATTSSTSYTDTAATDGTHTYKVTAVEAGAESSASNTTTVVLDTVRPTMTFTAPSSFAGPFATGPTVSVAASDTGSGLTTLVIHVYNSSNQLLNICGTATPTQLATGTLSCNLASLPSGTYNVRSGSFDGAGNNQTINSGSFVIQ
jgi:Rhamnogalacturonan I lyases beta-sheet domain